MFNYDWVLVAVAISRLIVEHGDHLFTLRNDVCDLVPTRIDVAHSHLRRQNLFIPFIKSELLFFCTGSDPFVYVFNLFDLRWLCILRAQLSSHTETLSEIFLVKEAWRVE